MKDVNPKFLRHRECVAELGMLHLMNASKIRQKSSPQKAPGADNWGFFPPFVFPRHILRGSGHPWSSRRGFGMTIPPLHLKLSGWDSTERVLSPISSSFPRIPVPALSPGAGADPGEVTGTRLPWCWPC